METPTRPLSVKPIMPTPGGEPTLGTALWTLVVFIVFTAIIFALVIYSPV